MKQIILLFGLLVAALALAACGAAPAAVEAGAGNAAANTTADRSEGGAANTSAATAALTETLLDEQGAVGVSIRPENVGQGAATLSFEVAMNTHSVDLSMDLATLATLTTDTGQEVGASAWQAPRGGHHVRGLLSFPATDGDGNNLLTGASQLTLTLRNVDAAARTFTWNLK